MLSVEEQAAKDKWLVDLRSGEYSQCKGQLHNDKTGGYCCLGVLQYGLTGEIDRDLVSQSPWALPSHEFWNRYPELSWPCSHRGTLSTLNDDQGMTLAEIADFIEKEWV